MARLEVKGSDEYELTLSRLGKASDEISKKVVMAGANPIADEIRKNLQQNISSQESVSLSPGGKKKKKTTTGSLLDGLGIAPPDIDYNGNTNTKIGFKGYDEKGVPNALKARVMESGSSEIKKRPFVRPAVNKKRQTAIEEMGKELNNQLKIYALKEE